MAERFETTIIFHAEDQERAEDIVQQMLMRIPGGGGAASLKSIAEEE